MHCKEDEPLEQPGEAEECQLANPRAFAQERWLSLPLAASVDGCRVEGEAQSCHGLKVCHFSEASAPRASAASVLRVWGQEALSRVPPRLHLRGVTATGQKQIGQHFPFLRRGLTCAAPLLRVWGQEALSRLLHAYTCAELPRQAKNKIANVSPF